MKTFALVFLFASTLFFAQQLPLKKLPELKFDSVKVLKFDKDLLKNFNQNNLAQQNNKVDYKILVKKPEHPELYSMLVSKPKIEVIPIPNSIKVNPTPEMVKPKSFDGLNIIK